MTNFDRACALAPALFLVACGAQVGSGDDAAIEDAAVCRPDPTVFDAQARPAIERYCGTCHGETPRFGAPVSLLDGANVVASGLAPLIAQRISDGSMPPAQLPRLPHVDADAIVGWATCGNTAPMLAGLQASAPVWLAPEDAPTLPTIDLTAQEFAVPSDASDTYRCFGFDASVSEDRFVRRIGVRIDEARVLHHLVLFRVPDASAESDWDCYGTMPTDAQYLYAWAPGQNDIQFPEGGLRISPSDHFVVQIHYNDIAGIPDLRDSSGVRLWLDAPLGTEWGMLAVGPIRFSIPARGAHSEERRCTFRTPTHVLAGMPHMHQLGSGFRHVIERVDGTSEPFFSLTGWRFDAQLFYALPVDLAPGDRLHTTCTWSNPGADAVSSGPRSEDEMCFDFLYVTPPPTMSYCDEGTMEPVDVTYEPGECAPPPGAGAAPGLVRGTFREGVPAVLAGGAVPDATWELASIETWASALATPLGTLDPDASFALGRGVAETNGGVVSWDVSTMAYLRSTSGLELAQPAQSSRRVSIDSASPTTTTTICPAAVPVTYEHEMMGEQLVLSLRSDRVPGTTLVTRWTFEPRTP